VSLWHPAKIFPGLRFERYADMILGAGVKYTPAVKGLFVYAAGAYNTRPEYYSTAGGLWMVARYPDSSLWEHQVGPYVGDGTNFRINNLSGTSIWFVLMRCY